MLCLEVDRRALVTSGERASLSYVSVTADYNVYLSYCIFVSAQDAKSSSINTPGSTSFHH